MRAPDSSPALGPGSSFILDACGGVSGALERGASFGRIMRDAERDEQDRDEYLARAGIGRAKRRQATTREAIGRGVG